MAKRKPDPAPKPEKPSPDAVKALDALTAPRRPDAPAPAISLGDLRMAEYRADALNRGDR